MFKPSKQKPETPSPSPRGPHSAHRTSTLLHFTQAVYLLFSTIYVCKDSVEHALLHHSGSAPSPSRPRTTVSPPLLLLSTPANITRPWSGLMGNMCVTRA
ncbi:hypothetical protein A4X06_0g6881 [Tilletia controversa]|uniref:Uncharacterized protein n=1 Tax=Tilletia controversa TaxID=13291 RepID=A0A8X7SUK3_9BASI|nr:hypothetical protein A4X06_0g6881 [Tilletia controversa]